MLHVKNLYSMSVHHPQPEIQKKQTTSLNLRFLQYQPPIVIIHTNSMHWMSGCLDSKYLPPLYLDWKYKLHKNWKEDLMKMLQQKFDNWREKVPLPNTRHKGTFYIE